MLSRLLPPQADNTYRGQLPGLWLFVLLVLMKLVMSVNSMLNPRQIATTADGIPLDTFPAEAAQTVVSMFALLALRHLSVTLICVVVLIRYRALVSLMLTLLLAESVARMLILEVLPISRAGAPPGLMINLILLGITALALVLSLWQRRARL